jgi:hypothetical protein
MRFYIPLERMKNKLACAYIRCELIGRNTSDVKISGGESVPDIYEVAKLLLLLIFPPPPSPGRLGNYLALPYRSV